MPFDVLPQEAKVGEFAKFADAMLKGCVTTEQCGFVLIDRNNEGAITHSCALGAYLIGSGADLDDGELLNGIYDHPVYDAYLNRYARTIDHDNDVRCLSREEIAARIAAL